MALNGDRRFPPQKFFRVKVAFGCYVVGHVFQPTGIYRDVLINRGIIEEVPDPKLPSSIAREAVTVRDTLTLRSKGRK